ncbi:MAG: flagellar filament capping protein FliD [Planctomycetes bacterium]|nr:flagellar filament capping protein FliD [Planctomycetota bacterium]
MSSISSGVGPVSGLPINQLVESLIAVQQRPITLLRNRVTDLGNQRTSLLKISANLLAILNSSARFKNVDTFQSAKAVSSDEQSILATASAGAPTGQFQITVKNLAAAHQVISTGFSTADTTPVGAGTLSIETAQARLNRATRLSALRGGAGVQHGKIKITDKAGGAATIDLATAVTLNDVVALVNNQSSASVRAKIEGDHLVLTDQTGLAAGSLAVVEVGASHSAADLGILATSATGVITGANLVSITGTTRLDELNDGNGIRRLVGAADFSVSLADGTALDIAISERIQLDTPLSVLNGGGGVPAGKIHVKSRNGSERDIDLSSAVTLGDVKSAIESAGANLTVTLGANGINIKDNSTGEKTFEISEVNAVGTAKALGILGTSTSSEITGKKIYYVDTVGDLARVINGKAGNGGKLVAAVSADGLGLSLTDTSSGAGTFQVTALNNSKAAEDLGLLTPASGNLITSRRLVSGLNTVFLRSLRGGAGVQAGTIQITDRAGATASVDVSTAQSLSDVIAAINNAGVGVNARVSDNGLGLTITDTTGGVGNLSISDVSGTAAADLQIAINSAANSVDSGNLQRQYVSTNTRLKDLRSGVGVPPGKFRITAANGATAVVDLTQGNEERLQDVIDEINSRGIGITASINSTGDGLLLTDTTGGGGKIKVSEEGGSTAKALGILGESQVGGTTINGSFEYKITITGGDTLNDVVAKIKTAGAPVNSTIFRDASSGRPFRLSLSSSISGLDGELSIDSGATGLAFTNLVQARDATVLLGPADADAPLVINSASNTLTDAVPNVRLDLVGLSSKPVTVSVAADTESVSKDINLFVSALNAAFTTIDDVTRFDETTNTRSILSGDSTVRAIRAKLVEILNRVAPGLTPPFNRLSSIGVELSNGNSARFDEAKFKKALTENPDAVQALFTTATNGFGHVIEKEMKRLTDAGTGVVSVQEDNIKNSQELLTNRISQMQTLLERRRERLFAQFNATESILARLQGQQSALAGISSIRIG